MLHKSPLCAMRSSRRYKMRPGTSTARPESPFCEANPPNQSQLTKTKPKKIKGKQPKGNSMATMTRVVPKAVLLPGGKPTEGAEALPLQTVYGVHTGHNSAVALVEDGVLKMALQEERLTRIKNQGGFPKNAIQMITAKSEADHGFDKSF